MGKSFRFSLALIFLAACSNTNAVNSSPDLATPGLPPNGADLSMPGTADLSGADLTTAGNPYASPGSATFTTTTAMPTLAGGQYTVTIYVPSTAGPRPVVAILPGFIQPGAGYTVYAERLASFGIIVLLRDDPGLLTGSPAVADQLTDEIATWLPAENAKSTGPLAGRVDLTKVGLMGHSRGGQVMLLAATTTLVGKVAAVFGLDPVDTSTGGTQARTTMTSLGVPSVFLGETLDGTSKFGFGMACAPAADNYQTLYAVAPAPSLQLTATGAVHFDFEMAASASGSSLCQTGTADPTKVLDMAVTLSTGFFARELLGQAVGADLHGAGADDYIVAGQLTRTQK